MSEPITADVFHEHKYILTHTVYVCEMHRNRAHYFRISTFFCESCLEEKEITREARDKENAPYWFVMQGCETRDAIERW